MSSADVMVPVGSAVVVVLRRDDGVDGVADTGGRMSGVFAGVGCASKLLAEDGDEGG
jgi:hypothetical protein